MCLPGALLRSVLLVLFLARSCGKRRCHYKEILGSYSEVISVELQKLNLGSSNTSLDRDPCPSGQVNITTSSVFSTMDRARRILASIYGLTEQVWCQRGGKQQSDLERPLESMGQLIVQKCRPVSLGKRASCSSFQKLRGKKRKRFRLIKVIKSLIICWQKLQSVYMLSK